MGYRRPEILQLCQLRGLSERVIEVSCNQWSRNEVHEGYVMESWIIGKVWYVDVGVRLDHE